MSAAYAYDRVSYPDHPASVTHPDRLGVMGVLAGLQPAPAQRCRVLEVGCGGGGNLIPLAWSLPQSQFLGFDLAAGAVASGCARIRSLGLRNVELRHLDLLDFPADAGEFDYVIAHGFYSWVPAAVREALLALCRSHLAAHGIAFVSYSVYPGAYLRRMLREMLLFHVDREDDPEARVAQARALATFLASSDVPVDEFGIWMRAEAQRVQRYLPGHLYHDDLAPINEPVWFHELVAQAARHGLHYLGEADHHAPAELTSLSQSVQASLAVLGDDLVLQGQYLDFLKCRRFRMSLLCRQEAAPMRSALDVATLRSLHVASPARLAAESLHLDDETAVRFEGEAGAAILVAHPAAKAGLATAAERWPETIAFEALLTDSYGRIARAWHAEAEQALARALVIAFGADVAFLHRFPPQYALRPGERPLVSPYARMQAAEGELVTTLRHRLARLADPLVRAVACRLDGTRDRAALAREIASDAEALAGSGRVDAEALVGRIEEILHGLAREALLAA